MLGSFAYSVFAMSVGESSYSVLSSSAGWYGSTAGGENTGAHAYLTPGASVAAVVAGED